MTKLCSQLNVLYHIYSVGIRQIIVVSLLKELDTFVMNVLGDYMLPTGGMLNKILAMFSIIINFNVYVKWKHYIQYTNFNKL